jgi:hypothetical protein
MNYARLLTEGVGSWLHFESACDRSGLFSEKYLTHPIGQILSARSGNRALAEYKHPVLAPLAKGAGRRPEIDFVICESYPTVSVAIESKWIGKSEPTVQSILWDLIRLELVAHHDKARCFFVLGGKRSALERLFARDTFSDALSKPHSRPVLRYKDNVLHKIDLVPTVPIRIPLLKTLFFPYQDAEFPHKIITRRSAPFPPDPKSNHFQVYSWEILAAERRNLFRPRNSKHYRVPNVMVASEQASTSSRNARTR